MGSGLVSSLFELRLKRWFSVNVGLVIIQALTLLLLPMPSLAFDDDVEKDLQQNLQKSKTLVQQIKTKSARGVSVSTDIAQLINTSENIKASDLLLEECFKIREEKLKTLGSIALTRHQTMAEGFRKALTDYLSFIDTIPSDRSITQSQIDTLWLLLEKLLPKKNHPIIGSLPYKHLNYSAQEPSTASAVTPAYQGGNKTVSPDDTKSTPEAPISPEIAVLAQSLNWQPVAIYEYVKNNIETEWYWGCREPIGSGLLY